MDILDIFLSASFWAATIRIACPLIFATLGELICERAGVLNLGIEGIMTAGAMAGWMWVYQGGDLLGGVLFAAFVGGLFGLLHAQFTVVLALSQHVTGIGITMLASALSYFVFKMLLPETTTPPKIVPFQNIEIPVLSELPFVGEVFFQHTALTYAAFIIVPIIIYILYKTPLGLALRVAGESPNSLESQGINVFTIRTLAVVFGSSLMAVAGAYLTMSAFDAFYFGMVNGRGWICVALVIFASWQPGKALLGALLFAGLDAMQVRVQLQLGSFIPYQVFLMLPYILSIVAMVLVARKAQYPKALLQPYRRGERS